MQLITVLSFLLIAAVLPKDWPSAQPERGRAAESGRIAVRGTEFVLDGNPFEWRGVTAFRLAEQVAHGREADAAAFLDWAARNGVTVVRVLAMAKHMFELSPEDGLAALPRLLEMAAARGIHVEIVALADTAAWNPDLEKQVAAAGAIAAAHPNALVEIANEPFHHTQDPRLHDRAILPRLAALVPEEVLVAHGSDAPGQSGGGDYVTVHMPRGGAPWEHVIALAEGHALVRQYDVPVVSDEPIGAADTIEPGGRDNDPDRFRAAAILTRMTGMHPTFHFESGLHARVPTPVEQKAYDAWRAGAQAVPAGTGPATFRSWTDKSGRHFESKANGEVWTLTISGERATLKRARGDTSS